MTAASEKLPYDIVIGLEVHVQLATQTKLFCGCRTTFGQPPNTNTCPVCIGLPGELPVLNRRAIELALRTGVALGAEIARFTKWDRKNYYYPDLPKGYQISQYDLPLVGPGVFEFDDPERPGEMCRVGIIRAHLEEDAGKSMHDEAAGVADSRIDLNRAGTPLAEIVTAPDMRSAAQAKRFLEELKLLLLYTAVSDCNMQEGSLRVDANVNLHVHPTNGSSEKIATPIVEIKNLNSFRAVERALTYEAQRQWDEYQATGKRLGQAPKQTRGWDDAAQVTRGQRHKEETSDYRYFPDPDLAPVRLSAEVIAAARAALPELPAPLRRRLQDEYKLSAYDADVIVSHSPELARYYLTLADGCGDGKLASNWIQQDVLRMLKESGATIDTFPVAAAALADLLKLVKAGSLDTSRARQVLAKMAESGQSAAQAMRALGIGQVDESELRTLCEELLAANPKIVSDVKSGNAKAIGQLVGQAKKRNPNINPALFQALCLELVAAMP